MWPWQKGPEMTRRDTPEMDIMGPGGTRRDITGGPGEVLLGSQEGCGYGTRMDTVMGPGGIMGPRWTWLWDQEGLWDQDGQLWDQDGHGCGTRRDTVMGPGGIMGPEWTRLWDQEGHGYGTRSMLSHGTRRDIIRRL